MKGVILAGGLGTRLSPLTSVFAKHMLPVGNKPMIQHAVEKMAEAKITEVMVITSPDHAGHIFEYLGSGKKFGLDLTYRVQDEADGIAGALMLAEDFVGYDNVAVILGDNIFEDEMSVLYSAWANCKNEAMVFLKKVESPGRFGVAEIDESDGTVICIEEKPKDPKSDFAVTGIYFYDGPKLFENLRDLKKSARGEYEITDVNNRFADDGNLSWIELDYFWSDAGTYESYQLANEWAWKKFNEEEGKLTRFKSEGYTNYIVNDSSTITGIEYYDDTKTMVVTFKNGGTYAYLNVERNVFVEFCESESKGKYLAAHIRNAYAYERLDAKVNEKRKVTNLKTVAPVTFQAPYLRML